MCVLRLFKFGLFLIMCNTLTHAHILHLLCRSCNHSHRTKSDTPLSASLCVFHITRAVLAPNSFLYSFPLILLLISNIHMVLLNSQSSYLEMGVFYYLLGCSFGFFRGLPQSLTWSDPKSAFADRLVYFID